MAGSACLVRASLSKDSTRCPLRVIYDVLASHFPTRGFSCSFCKLVRHFQINGFATQVAFTLWTSMLLYHFSVILRFRIKSLRV
jgi:hypothetical protein